MIDNAPIFIGGPDRCGKTMLAAVLASHPRIAISAVGSNLWPYFYRRFGDLRDDADLERCLSAMLRYKHVAYLDPDPGAIRAEFLRGERTYARLFAIVQAQHAARLGKPRWGDQTGLVERWADEIFAAYPGVRMIHMLRDPRDRYHASLEMWPSGRLRAGGASGRWLLSAELAERNQRRHGDRYRVVRYETLVQEPEATIRELCAFIGEAFVPAMMEMGAMPGVRAKLEAGLASVHAPGHDRVDDASPRPTLISPAFVGAYRGRIPPAELAFLQRHASKRMAGLGYIADDVPMRLGERIRYWFVTEPMNRVRMRAWRWREAAAYRMPGRFGRRLRAEMVR